MEPKPFFEGKNSLEERVGTAFFEELPKSSGIYKMLGRDDSLLYVGKAKNLRNRLFTYRRVSSENSSRKVRRLVRMIHHITFEQLPSEEQALLRENELIQKHRPPFNRAKKAPETYYYIIAKPTDNTISFHLRMNISDHKRKHIYGAFKGHRRVRRALGALLRQLYILEHTLTAPFDLPVQLTRNLTPMHFEMEVSDNILPLVDDYLNGKSDKLLFYLVHDHRNHNRLEVFIGKLIMKDMEALRWFYDKAARRNYEIVQKFELKEGIIPQDRLDDYLFSEMGLCQRRGKLKTI